MAQNITLLGASYSDCPAVLLPKTGGGTARFDDASVTTATASDVASGKIFLASDGTITTGTSSGGGGGDYPWFGANTTYVGRKLTKTINLKNDTTWDSWTASTTAGSIKAGSSSADLTFTVDYTNGYWFVYKAYIEYVYNAGATLKSIPKRGVTYSLYLTFPYFSNNSNLIANTCNTLTYSTPVSGRGGLRHYGTTANTLSFYAGANYGAYIASPTFALSTTTATIKLGAVSARCNNTYFATARKVDIDSANTNLVVTVDVYKTPIPNDCVSYLIESMRTDMTTGL